MNATMSEEIGNLLAALATAQGQIDNVTQDREVEVPIKDKANPGTYKGKYKYRYATLPGILNHIREAFTGNGIWYTQFVNQGEMVTRLFHKSGEWMDSGNVPMPDVKGSPQDIGGIISYFKRYSLTAAVGLAAEDDSDGEEGDREVHFRSRGNAPTNAETQNLEEPPMGWGDWARGLIEVVGTRETEEEMDALKETNKRFINSAKKVDKVMFDAIQTAFTTRRAVIRDDVPF